MTPDQIIQERNRLRMQTWELDEQIQLQMQIPKAFRNYTRIEALQVDIRHIELQISRLSDALNT